MDATLWIAAVGLAVPLYSYVAYPVVLFLMAALVQTGRDAWFLLRRHERRSRTRETPAVSIVIAAYNEEGVIAATLERCLASDYPAELLEVVVGLDGCTDGTAEVCRRFAARNVRVLVFADRRGKTRVLDECVRRAKGDVLVLTDANTLLQPDAVRQIMRHFPDERIGAVCGELRLRTAQGTPADEGAYWHYEVVLKMLESRVDSVLGANGALYAVRRELFPQLPRDYVTDDFVIPMKVRTAGRRVIYDPEAVATEPAVSGSADEFRRRMRIGAGNWQALGACWPLLLPWKGFVSFAFWSHKVLRWFTPFLLVAALAASLFTSDHPFGLALLAGQLLFYGTAATGGLLCAIGLPAGPLRLAWYFVLLNVALGVGMVKGMAGAQKAAWQRTARHPEPTEGDR